MRTFTRLLSFIIALSCLTAPAFATSGFNSWLVREKVKRPFGTDKKVTIAIDARREIGELRYVNTLDPAAGQDRQARIPYANILIQVEQGLPAEVRGKRDQDKKPIVIKWLRAFCRERPRTLVLLDKEAKERLRSDLNRENRRLPRRERLSKWDIENDVHPYVIEAEIPAEEFEPGDLIQITIAQQQYQDPIRIDLQVGMYSVKEYLEYEGAKNNPELLEKLMLKWSNRRESKRDNGRHTRRGERDDDEDEGDLDLDREREDGNRREIPDDRRSRSLPGRYQGTLIVKFLERNGGPVYEINLEAWLYCFRNGSFVSREPIVITNGYYERTVSADCAYAVKISPASEAENWYYVGNPDIVTFQGRDVATWPIRPPGTAIKFVRRNR